VSVSAPTIVSFEAKLTTDNTGIRD